MPQRKGRGRGPVHQLHGDKGEMKSPLEIGNKSQQWPPALEECSGSDWGMMKRHGEEKGCSPCLPPRSTPHGPSPAVHAPPSMRSRPRFHLKHSRGKRQHKALTLSKVTPPLLFPPLPWGLRASVGALGNLPAPHSPAHT